MEKRGQTTNTVKNRNPAPVQISAEQILRDANERQKTETKTPSQRLQSAEELDEWRLAKRRDFENSIRRQRHYMGTWIKYAKWEESQGELGRARSVFERALDLESTDASIWLKYVDFEVRNKCVNHARDLLDRATTILPRQDKLWMKYVYIQEMLGDIVGARKVFESWMQWLPTEQPWHQYIKFEQRQGSIQRARELYERFIIHIPEADNYINYAKWEEKQSNRGNCRDIFERALNHLSSDLLDENFYMEFARFETRCHEIERARTIYKHGIQNIVGDKSLLESAYSSFEKQFGSREDIEQTILAKRRAQYETLLAKAPFAYDVWFDYLQLLESEAEPEEVCRMYEKAVKNVPQKLIKIEWKRYMYLWIYYAVYCEVSISDLELTEKCLKDCLSIIPHKSFTFSKIWLHLAHFYLRQHDIDHCRQVLGRALGTCPTIKLYREYIELEHQLYNIDRCRILYEKFIMYKPERCGTWIAFAELEGSLGETERARKIYETGIKQESLDTPDLLWKRYIDYEVMNQEHTRVVSLFERMLELAQHPKIYVTYAQYLKTQDVVKAREIISQGISYFKDTHDDEHRSFLLHALLEFEQSITEGNESNIESAKSRQAMRTQKKVMNEQTGEEEEVAAFLFPDDKKNIDAIKLMQIAKLHKEKKSMLKKEG